MYFGVDDVVLAVYVNRESIPLPFSCQEKMDYRASHRIALPILKPGDVVTIAGQNGGGASGIVATLHYINPQGKEIAINTNGSWYCNGIPSIALEANDGRYTWPIKSGINPDAWYIWTSEYGVTGSKAACSFIIPCNM